MAGFLKNLFDKKGKVPKVDIARRFELLARVGQGSMSKVWRARDAMTGKMLAVKVLDKMKTERFEARFIGLKKPGEGEISISLQHVNVVKTIEHGMTTADEPYLVMDFVEGLSLSYLVDVQNEQMQIHCLNYVIQLGAAISYLHRQNWIHRDLCPRNVMVNQDNVVKLIDFGLVVPNTPDFQKPGNRTGTANYMAPELIKRQKTDQRIDVYSFSVTAYEMYTKRLPWDVPAQETLDTVLQHINKPPTPIKQLVSDIHPQVAETIMKGLRPNPDDRWQTIDEMLVPLRKVHEEIEAKRTMERRKKAASAKIKSSSTASVAADAKAKAKKAADDDAFVDQLLLGDGTTRAAKPKEKPSPSAVSKTSATRPAAPGLSKNAGKSSAPVAVKGSKSTASPKNAPPAPKLDIEDDDEFDGIEIEIEGDKLDGIKAEESSDEFDGIEIEVDGDDVVAGRSRHASRNEPNGKTTSKSETSSNESSAHHAERDGDVDNDDDFDGIEVEEVGDLPVELPAMVAAESTRKIPLLFDDDDDDRTKAVVVDKASADENHGDDDDEPVLRLPDDDDDLIPGIEIEEDAAPSKSTQKPGAGK